MRTTRKDAPQMSNEGKKVKIHYTGSFDDGEVFDTSRLSGEPLEFECGSGMVIKGFDDAVRDMEVGEKKHIHLEPAEAYGEVDEKLIQTVPVDRVPNAQDLPVGESVYMQGPNGQPFPVKVVSMDDKNVVFDMNHPMAGKPLNFELELVEVEGA